MKESLVLAQEAIAQNDGTAIKTTGLDKLQDIMTEAKEKARSMPRRVELTKSIYIIRRNGIQHYCYSAVPRQRRLIQV